MSGGSQSEGASNSASPASSVALSNPSSTPGINNNAPKYGTLVPNRIFVGGISSNTTEAELSQLFSKYGNVKGTKIIVDRAGVSKGYGFVTFESEEEVKFLTQDTNNIVLKDRRLNIAPAIKKQPVSLQYNRSYDASTPPPAAPSLYFHNGVPYTFHNGMAFFPPTPHQPALTALQNPADPCMYQSYGQSQNTPAAHYGTPVLVPTHPPLYMPQNYQYQPLPMTNGAPTQFMYTGSGGSNSGSGSPLGGTPDTPHLPSPMAPPPSFYPQQFPPEAYYHQPFYVSYSYNSNEYESQDQQTNDDCSSTVSTPHSDISDRSSNRSPNVPIRSPYPVYKSILSNSGSCPDMTNTKVQSTTEPPPQSNADSHVPVVSWRNLKNHAEERELHIRDGRRAFHPIVPPRPVPQMMIYQQPQFQNNFVVPNNTYQQQQSPMGDNTGGQRQSFRGRPRPNVPTNIPFIPKFPASFNNNNPLALNNNYYDKKPVEVSNVRPQRFMNKPRVNGRVGDSPPPRPNSNPNSNPNSCVTSPSHSPQMQPPPLPPQFETVRYNSVVAGTALPPPRWSNNPPVNSHQIKRLVCNNNNSNNNNNNHKRPNGSVPNVGMPNSSGSVRLTKKTQTAQDTEGDLGGGGDAQPQLASTPPSTPSTDTGTGGEDTVTTGMQTLSLSASS